MRRQAIWVLTLALVACSSPPPAPTVVFDGIKVLADGDLTSYKLEPGRYHLELTASHSGVRVEWGGGLCSEADNTKRLVTECTLTQSGQLVVQNPPTLGISLGSLHLGSPTSVSIRLLRYPPVTQ